MIPAAMSATPAIAPTTPPAMAPPDTPEELGVFVFVDIGVVAEMIVELGLVVDVEEEAVEDEDVTVTVASIAATLKVMEVACGCADEREEKVSLSCFSYCTATGLTSFDQQILNWLERAVHDS